MQVLPATMQALVLTAPGAPLALREVPCPRPRAGQVLVRMAASVINPSDLAMLEGAYGLGWPYPLIPGLEGAGRVVAAQAGLYGRYLMGRRVALAAEAQGLWAEYAAVPAARVLPLPAQVGLAAGASSFVNPMTAVALVAEVRRAGQWAAVSTAAGGALGRMIRARGKAQGVKIINVVRRAAQADALRAEGARYVLNETAPSFDADLKALCRDLRCRMALDAVGGAMTYRLAEALPRGGTILVYGGLGGKAASLYPGTMIFKGLTVRGFWLSQWLSRKNLPQMLWLGRQVTRGLAGGFAQTQIARTVPLDEAVDAPAAYAAAMSTGKTVIAPAGLAALED